MKFHFILKVRTFRQQLQIPLKQHLITMVCFGKILDSKKVSIKDIASKSGVSIGTVDRVIHQRGEVSEKTRKKVLKVIEALNYQPNLIARSLASKKKLRLAILLPSANSENEYWHFPQIGIKKALNLVCRGHHMFHDPVVGCATAPTAVYPKLFCKQCNSSNFS